MSSGDAWRDQLSAWAIPDRILAAVPDSPWTIPAGVFTRRTRHQLAEPSGRSWERATQALPPAGSVLDIGAGAGAASLPLAPADLTAVDTSAPMLEALTGEAASLGIPVRTVLGRWPDVAAQVEPADIVVCHHVVYNVPDLADFVRALDDHARCRVVIELTAQHPLAPLNPLWRLMHDLDRPDGPNAQDAAAVLREAGLTPTLEISARPGRPEYASFDELVAVTRRRLCLTPERDSELSAALIHLGVDPDHPRDLPPPDDHVVTLWWNRR